MRKQSRLKILVAVAVLGLSTTAFAKVDIELTYQPTYTMGSGSPAPTAAFGALGGGLNLDFMLSPSIALVLGTGYRSTAYTISGTTSTFGNIVGEAGFDFHLNHAIALSLGGSFYYYLTNPLAFTGKDFGAYGGLKFFIPMGSMKFEIGAAYRYAFTTMTYPLGTLTPSHIVGFVGLMFGGK